MLVLDSGGLSRLAQRNTRSVAILSALREAGLWPPLVLTIVMAESLSGNPGRDARVNQFLKTCDIADRLPPNTARRAAQLRRLARYGSVVDAVVVAMAEPGGTVLTQDLTDLSALASRAEEVAVERA